MTKRPKVSNQQLAISRQQFTGKVLVLAFIFILNFSVFSFNSYSQNAGVSINATGAPPNSKALLDIDATGMNPKAGVLVPRMSTTYRNAITGIIPESLIIYNTDMHCFEAFYNGGWVDLACLSVCQVPVQPTVGTNISSQTQIVWNWSDASSPVSYKYGTTTVYSSSSEIGTNTSFTQTGLTCNTSYTLNVWAYNNCGNSLYITLTQTSSVCSGPSPCIWNSSNSFTDLRDGQSYNQVQIGTQCWMAQNLNYGTFVGVHSSPQLTGEKFCANLSNTDDTDCPLGGLYEWANMMNGSGSCNGIGAGQPGCTTPVQGLCPDSWHVPSHYEWVLLEQTVCAQSPAGGNCASNFPYDVITTSYQGTTEGGKIKITTICGTLPCWNSPNTGATNSSGFSVISDSHSWEGSLNNVGSAGRNADFWTASETNSGAWRREIGYNYSTIYRDYIAQETNGYQVRCVKD